MLLRGCGDPQKHEKILAAAQIVYNATGLIVVDELHQALQDTTEKIVNFQKILKDMELAEFKLPYHEKDLKREFLERKHKVRRS